MNPEKLKERLHRIKATPYRPRVGFSEVLRRDENYIVLEESSISSDISDSLFDFDDDIDTAKPARELVMLTLGNDADEDSYSTIELPPEDSLQEKDPDRFIMVEATPDFKNFSPIILDQLKVEEGHEYSQCGFEKTDGERCKRQSLKGNDVCAIHKKYLEKHAK